MNVVTDELPAELPAPNEPPPAMRAMLQVCTDKWGPLYLTAQVAEIIGVNLLTVKRWRWDRLLVPSYYFIRGDQTVPLYTPSDVQEGVALKGTIPPGPKPRQ